MSDQKPSSALDEALGFHAAGNLSLALSHLSKAIGRWPKDFPLQATFARLALDAGQPVQALQAARSALRLSPFEPTALTCAIRAAVRLSDPSAAKLADELREQAHTNPESAFGLALLALDQGQTAEAERHLAQALVLNPNHRGALGLQAAALDAKGQTVAAKACFEKVLALAPGDIRASMGAARIESKMGDFRRAEGHYRAILEKAPGYAPALAGLLGTRPADTAALLEKADAALDSGMLAAAASIELGYAAAKAHDRLGQFSQAFARAGAANALQARAHPYIAQQEEAALRAHLARWLPSRWPPPAQSTDVAPILICGMPRSGTTLLESMLARHSATSAGGEIPFFRKSAAWVASEANPDGAFRSHAADLARAYRAGLATRAAGKRFVTDKMPENWRHVGLATALLGPFPIIRMVRDRRDVAVSIFLEHFAPQESFAHSLDAIAHTMALEDEAWMYWIESCGIPVVTIQYEDLVESPRDVLAALLPAIGLPFEAECLLHQQRADAVSTPSKWQVRQPIYKSSIGRWRNYSNILASTFIESQSD